MPNTGKPSSACHLCRARRVKCDLTLPGCLRCPKVGTVCPGYREEQDLLFHNQNKASFAASGRKQRGRSKLEAVGENRSSASSTSNRSLSPLPVLDKLSTANNAVAISHSLLPPPLVEDWHSYSVPVVLHQFSAPTDSNRFYRFLDFLPDLYRKTSEGSCLNLATDALAKAFITNMSESSPKRAEHVQTYGRALRATNIVLQDPLERVKDSTIIAVWLLGVHEVIVNSPGNFPMAIPGPQAWHAHSQGIASLLCVRGPYQFSTKRGRNLFWMMYIFIQIHCLVANTECPPESLAWFELLKHGLTEYDQLAFTASNYNYKISALCSRLHNLFRRDTSANENVILQAMSILTATDALQNDTRIWIALAQLQPTDLCSLHVINTFRAALLKLQHFLILLLDHIMCHPQVDPMDIHVRRQKYITTTHLLSREILDSLPHGLGDDTTPQETRLGCWAEGMRFLWPLIVVSWMTHGLQHHREEAKLALRRIGLQMGIKLALNCDPPAGRFVNE